MTKTVFHSTILTLFLSFNTLCPFEVNALDFSEHFNGAARIDGDSTWIYLEGTIETGDAEKFERFLQGRSLWPNQRIVLNSGGGSVLEGIKIGRIIRDHDFRTAVAASFVVDGYSQVSAGVCASACVLTFAGGVERAASDGSRIGVHQMSRDYSEIINGKPITIEDLTITMSDAQRLIGISLTHFIEMGIDPVIISLMVGTSADDIRWLTLDEIFFTKIGFAPSQFTPWMIEPYRNGLVAYSRSRDQDKQLTLFCGGNGQMKFLLKMSGNPYDTSYDPILAAGRFRVAGLSVPMSEASVEFNDGELVLTGPWYSEISPSGQLATFSLLGEVTGTVSDAYSLYSFNYENFEQTVDLARKNCI